MEEAEERLRNEMPHETVQLKEILEYLAFALFKQGNLKRALLLTEQLYTIDPNHPRAKNNIKWYENLLSEAGVKPIDYRRNIPPIVNPRPKSGLETKENEIYEALCRNEVPVSVKATSKLYCYYKMDRPFLRLAPFKTEILRFSPLVVLFRDVISDDEVTMIQMLATSRLRRATVQNSVTGQLETASYRTSKSAWLKDEEHEIVHRINRRIDLMTNLEQETAEELQVGNYGIGGHYDPHFDFARREEVNAFESLNTGNRMATLLFYMTQPEAGGATVFTHVKTAVLPTKNDALFWYNLLRSGTGDLRTRHAACPVLTGSKWVANKWIHERGQEFRRPCGLVQSVEEQFVGDLGA
uniref:Fe2OG dioxygenase domain-containing protein n=1 Tax=Elaeophora elaphi TaxID=1147741 RepID=A0A0R3RL89_9BILA